MKFSNCHKLWVSPRFLLCSEFLSQHSIITGFPMCKTLYTQSLFRVLPHTLCDSNTLQRNLHFRFRPEFKTLCNLFHAIWVWATHSTSLIHGLLIGKMVLIAATPRVVVGGKMVILIKCWAQNLDYMELLLGIINIIIYIFIEVIKINDY